MKKTVFFLFLVVLTTSHTFAKTWRVNNNAGDNTANFTTLSDAHAAATAGDTIYLEGSPTSYGALTCTKKLVILGPGYFLAENNIGNLDTQSAKVGSFSMSNGSQGSQIIGLDFNGSTIHLMTSDITIKQNKFGNVNTSGVLTSSGVIYLNWGTTSNNIIITQNFGVNINYSSNNANSGILIMNNVISVGSSDNTTSTCLQLSDFTMAVVQNNIFVRGKVNAHRAAFTNNIMVNGFFEPRENSTSNNLASATQFGTENGNQANVAMSAVFLNTGSPDERWKLIAGSPAIGAGYGSTSANPIDAGIFWGNTPYKLSGLFGIPVIYFMNVQSVGSSTDPIDVTVKVKSTN
ncbi:hypothetical protein [Botryobacter ruber]|uniref:hypothetical protein n=1 Tax=Botryobacter ruber TaxID=2171629 RepID=UPI000E0C260B|nr:hypothetical protein [Botryobacter ruber]